MTHITNQNDPITGYSDYPGLTKREHFASLAMQAMVNTSEIQQEDDLNRIAYVACDMADALIRELNASK